MMHEKRARNARPYGYGATIAATFFPQRCRGAHRAPVMEICVKFRIFSFTVIISFFRFLFNAVHRNKPVSLIR